MLEDEKFGRAVRRLREQVGWSQGELAERLKRAGHANFHTTTVSRIEKGERPVRLSEAVAMATALNSNVVEMLLPGEVAQNTEALSRTLRELEETRAQLFTEMAGYLRQQRILEYRSAKVAQSIDDPDAPVSAVEREHLAESLRKGAELLKVSLEDLVTMARRSDEATRYRPPSNEA